MTATEALSADGVEAEARQQIRGYAAIVHNMCGTVARTLEEQRPDTRSKTPRTDIDVWAAALRRADDESTVMEMLNQTDFRVRIDVAEALRCASEFLAERRTNVIERINDALTVLVVTTAQSRIELRAAKNENEHDDEAISLAQRVTQLFTMSSSLIDTRYVRLTKDDTANRMVRWLAGSQDEYDQRLAPVMQYVVKLLVAQR